MGFKSKVTPCIEVLRADGVPHRLHDRAVYFISAGSVRAPVARYWSRTGAGQPVVFIPKMLSSGREGGRVRKTGGVVAPGSRDDDAGAAGARAASKRPGKCGLAAVRGRGSIVTFRCVLLQY